MKFSNQSRSLPTLSNSEVTGYIILLILGFVLLSQFAHDRDDGIKSAHTSFDLRHDAEARAVSNEINEAFLQMYQGLRTIARLPGVRKLGPQFQFLSDDARISTQEIYNNLSENLSVSELYIVPADFDPSSYEANSTNPVSPLITFDDLIVGRNAEQPAGRRSKGAENNAVEEIEIYEYRTMKRQIDTLQAHYPDEATITGLAYPAIASAEVITCDNSRYAPSAPNDDDRKGIVYSIPFYGVDGAFRGIVTAVVLSSVIVEHLPGGQHALRNENYDMTLGAKSGGLWKDNLAPERRDDNVATPSYVNVTPLTFPDVTSGWTLWSGARSDAFASSTEVSQIHAHFRDQVAVLLLGLTMVAAALRLQAERHRSVQRLNVELEKRITERTEALADAKQEAELANTAKSQFLARISHEVRTPIHAIMSAAELLKNGRVKDLDATKVGIIMSSSRTLLELVNQVLDLSSIEQGRMELVLEPFLPEDLAKDVANMLQANAEQKRLTLTSTFIGDPEVRVISDPKRMRQVLINLVGNAIKYTREGHVDIKVELQTFDNRTPRLRFDVTDSGEGIAQEHFAELFEPFRRIPTLEKADGAGLGLSISRTLAELMGGAITFTSAVGNGSTFSFTVPVTISSCASEGAPDSQERTDLTIRETKLKANVLLAEDNADMQALTSELLEKIGCTYEVASDGIEVIAKLEQPTAFDVVLMDCSMPRLGGLEATREIRSRETLEKRAPIPIIALTANAFDSDEAACRAAGMDGFLSKPFTSSDLAKAINAILAAH